MNPPFGVDANYAGLTTQRLTGLASRLGAYQFAYDTAGAGELAQVTFPTGGHLRWTYQSFQYAGARTLREITNRYVAANLASLSTEWSYSLTHPDASNAVAMHTSGTIVGATPANGTSAPGAKKWTFLTGTNLPAWQLGLVSDFVQKAYENSTNGITHDSLFVGRECVGQPVPCGQDECYG